jgi:hypothetical protein
MRLKARQELGVQQELGEHLAAFQSPPLSP